MQILTGISILIRKFATKSSTMKYLNVAEKNDAAKNIAGLLSNGTSIRREGLSVYNKIFDFESTVRGQKSKMTMTSVSGHMLNYAFIQSYKNWHTCRPEQLFDAPIRKIVTEQSEKVKKTLEREIKGCQGLIIWTDCDREGENIGFEVIDVCKAIRPNIQIYRAKFSEITTAAVRRAVTNLAQPDQNQNYAVNVRQEIDLRTGAAITRFQTLRFQRLFPQNIADKMISYGSCQIPTLGFVAERYKEIEDFVSEPFWKIKVTHTIGDLTVEFNWDRNRLFNKEACEEYLMLCLSDPKATVENVSVKPKNKWRPTPMDTVALEKLGSKKLKINAKDTMAIAEKLYTQGLISYPRTETNIFSNDVNLRALVEQHAGHQDYGVFANRVLEWGPNPRNGTKSDQAHPPIHPTKFTTNLSGNDARIYELIVRHFLACVSKDATGSETIVNINIAGEKFHANGLVIFERNYLDVYPYENWNAKQIHKYEIREVFEPTEISMQEGATTAPPLLTEADLITLMEKHGIGTDATHAEHIHKIKERGYIGEVDRGFLVPGTIGMGLYEGYMAMDLALAKPMLRAEFEADLKKICDGLKDPKIVLSEQIVKYKEAYRIITERITAMDEKFGLRINEEPVIGNNNFEHDGPLHSDIGIQEVFRCPKCDICQMAIKTKKNNTGFFIGCLNFPDCRNVVWLSDGIKEAKVSTELCENCGTDSHKINFKFKQNSYLGLLNATSTTYQTCLRCDSNFRTIFEINLDQVKKTGPIIDDRFIQTDNQNNRNQTNNINRSLNNPTNPVNSLFLSSSTTAPRSSGNRNGSNNNNRKKNKTSTRNYSSTSTVTLPQTSSNYLVEAEMVNDIDLLNDDWDTDFSNSTINRDIIEAVDAFDCDDGFDDILGNSELETNSTRSANAGRSNYSTLNTQSNSGHNFNARASSPQNAPHNLNEDISCTKCGQTARKLVVRKEGPNTGRSFFSCTSQCSFFQWADELTSSPSTSGNIQQLPHLSADDDNSVKCNGCNQPAKSLTVRKEGPNQGRQFYVCSTSQACGFFKWGDENANPNQDLPRRNNSTSRVTASTSRGAVNSNRNSRQNESKKRKCGLCRSEGHTKLKCPRKDEFQH